MSHNWIASPATRLGKRRTKGKRRSHLVNRSAERWNTSMKRPVKLPIRRSRFADRRQISSERARPLNQPGAVRANGFVFLIVKLTSGGPSHFYARSTRHVNRAGARYDPTEASRTLRDGSQQRPRVLIALTPLA